MGKNSLNIKEGSTIKVIIDVDGYRKQIKGIYTNKFINNGNIVRGHFLVGFNDDLKITTTPLSREQVKNSKQSRLRKEISDILKYHIKQSEEKLK